MIRIPKLVCRPNIIKMNLLRAYLHTNHDMPYSEPKQEPVIELSYCAEVIQVQRKKKIK